MILVVATDFDNLKEYLLSTYKIINETISIFNTEAYLVKTNNKEVLFLKANCTNVLLTLQIQRLLNNYPITSIIGIGNTATTHNSIKLNDIAVVTSSFEYDVNFTALGYPFNFIPALQTIYCNCNQEYIKQVLAITSSFPNQTHLGIIGSSNQFIASNYCCKQIKCKTKIDFIDTESAPINEIAFLYNLPSVIVKGISNHASNNATNEYLCNKEKSNNLSFTVAINLIEQLTLQN